MAKQHTKLLSAYLLVGTDEVKRKRVLDRLKSYLDPAMELFNLDEFQLKSDTLAQEVVDSLNQIPQGDLRLVIVHAETEPSKEFTDGMLAYLKNPNPTSVFCLDCKSLRKNHRLYKAICSQDSKALILCEEPAAKNMSTYVFDRAKQLGLNLDTFAVTELIKRAGSTTLMVDAALLTLKNHVPLGQRIGQDEVRQFIAMTAEQKPWPFLDAVSQKNTAFALKLYKELPANSEILLVSLVSERVRDLICTKALDERGQTALLAQELKKQAWQVKNYLGWSRKFSTVELRQALYACAACDWELKNTSYTVEAFIKLIIQITQGA